METISVMPMHAIRIPPGFESLESGQTHFDAFQAFLSGGTLRAMGAEVLVTVVDTDVLVRDLKYTLRHGKLTYFPLAARTGLLRFFASRSIRGEMARKIQELAPVMGWDPAAAYSVWETQYAPWVRFLDVSNLPPATPEVARTYDLDPTDGPTAQVATLLSPDFVFSCNHHHLPGYDLVGDDWVTVSRACQNKHARDMAFIRGVSCGSVVCGLSWAGAQQLVRRVGTIDRRILLGLTVAAGIALAHPKTRAWLVRCGQSLSIATDELASNALPRLHERWTALEAASTEGAAIIERRRRAARPQRKLRDYATAALARATAPMTVGELAAAIRARGYRAKGAGTVAYLDRVLRTFPQLFEDSHSARWVLATSTGASGPAASPTN